VLLIDSGAHVLMLEHRTDPATTETVWAAPGGGCEAGETPAQAACRELREECGIDLRLPRNRPPDHTERRRWHVGEIAYDQTDHFFIVRATGRPRVIAEYPKPLGGESVLGHRWFSASDLRTCAARYEPAELCALLAGLPRGGRE